MLIAVWTSHHACAASLPVWDPGVARATLQLGTLTPPWSTSAISEALAHVPAPMPSSLQIPVVHSRCASQRRHLKSAPHTGFSVGQSAAWVSGLHSTQAPV